MDELTEEESVKKAEILFSKIDINNEGYVTEEEFVAVCLGDRDLVTVMKSDQSWGEFTVNIFQVKDD